MVLFLFDGPIFSAYYSRVNFFLFARSIRTCPLICKIGLFMMLVVIYGKCLLAFNWHLPIVLKPLLILFPESCKSYVIQQSTSYCQIRVVGQTLRMKMVSGLVSPRQSLDEAQKNRSEMVEPSVYFIFQTQYGLSS